MKGIDLINLAKNHLGESYILGAMAPKNDPSWNGPWDCAEFVSWMVYQVSGRLYGCHNNLGNAATADAYTGYWKNDSERLGTIISVEQAIPTAGAALLRAPAAGLIGHIVFCDGEGGTVEAHSRKKGVIRSVIQGRRWDYGVLVPWIEYDLSAQVEYKGPKHMVYRYTQPRMVGPAVGRIQQALMDAGFDPQGIDNIFGINTLKAVEAFQDAQGLVADGEVGKQTAAALGITL